MNNILSSIILALQSAGPGAFAPAAVTVPASTLTVEDLVEVAAEIDYQVRLATRAAAAALDGPEEWQRVQLLVMSAAATFAAWEARTPGEAGARAREALAVLLGHAPEKDPRLPGLMAGAWGLLEAQNQLGLQAGIHPGLLFRGQREVRQGILAEALTIITRYFGTPPKYWMEKGLWAETPKGRFPVRVGRGFAAKIEGLSFSGALPGGPNHPWLNALRERFPSMGWGWLEQVIGAEPDDLLRLVPHGVLLGIEEEVGGDEGGLPRVITEPLDGLSRFAAAKAVAVAWGEGRREALVWFAKANHGVRIGGEPGTIPTAWKTPDGCSLAEYVGDIPYKLPPSVIVRWE